MPIINTGVYFFIMSVTSGDALKMYAYTCGAPRDTAHTVTLTQSATQVTMRTVFLILSASPAP